MDDEPMWAADRVGASTPGFTITIPETANEFTIKVNIIKIFYYGLSEITQEVLNAAASGIFLYKTPNQAYQLLEDKVLLKLDWAKNQKTKSSLKKTVAFADEGSSNSDTDKIMARMDAMTLKMDAQYKELQTHSKKTKPDLDEDDIPMSREEEAKFMQTFRKTRFYNDYRDRDSNRDNWRSNEQSSYNRDNYRSNTDDKPYDLQKQFNDFMKSQQSTNAFAGGSEDSRRDLAEISPRLTAQAFVACSVRNNRLRASSNTRNQAVVQGDRVNIQSRNSGNVGRNNRRAYVQGEVVEGMNATNETANVQRIVRTPTPGNTSTGQCYNCGGKGHYARNYPKPRVRDSKYFMEQMLLAKHDEAGGILTDEQNDFLFADASKMEEIEEISANICLMARIQPADQNYDDEPSYESAFVSEVQSSSINENDEQMYPTHTKIINSTIDDDQINSNIQFDSVKGNVNSGSVEKDTHVYDQCALETLARNAYAEAAKQ
ncbi:reverse transcriptase domain-containing protein [Tanacetum coccineum]